MWRRFSHGALLKCPSLAAATAVIDHLAATGPSALQQLANSRRPRLLLVSHRWGGGVERHVQDVARVAGEVAEVLLLRPDGVGTVELSWIAEGETFQAWYAVEAWSGLLELLAAIGISRLHFHHVHELPRTVLDLPAALDCPYDVTLHDYFPICPRYHLTPGPGDACDEASVACDRCVDEGPSQWGLSVGEWRALFQGFLRGATRVIAPSQDCAARVQRYFPDVTVSTWPHPEVALALPVVHKVALVGGISAIKGARVLEACVADARARRLPLHFHVIGHVERPMPVHPEAPLTIGGSYADEQLGWLIAAERPEAFLFLPQVAETYSYTLSAALATGLPIVALAVGAFPERLRTYPRHALLPRDAHAGQINDALLALMPSHSGPIGGDVPNELARAAATWRERYLEPLHGLEAPAGRPSSLPSIPPQVWFRPARHVHEDTLRDLYNAGVRAGHAETRRVLERRIDWVDQALPEATRALAAARHEAEALRRELAAVQASAESDRREFLRAIDAATARIREIETSTAWRVTAPARAVGHRAKSSLRALRELPRRLRLVRPRLATARAIARDEGVGELARRLAGKLTPSPAPSGLVARAGLAAAIGPLHVPAAEAPRVSVIIPTYGQDLHTFSCLVAVAREAASVPLEAIVADDAAPTAAAEALRQVTGVRFERSVENRGFLRNCNRAASLARGEYLLFLNNDAVLGAGALQALLDVFAREPRAGAVGAKLVYPDGRLQEAGGIVWRDGSAWNWGRGDDPAKPEFNYVREADYCSAACLLVPRALFQSLGGFDERYAPAYYEDTDLCFRIREAGRKVYYQPGAEVVHFEGVSHGLDTGAGVKRHQLDNRERFTERWRAVLARHRVNGMLPRLEADRDASVRVLWVEARMVAADQDSGSVRTARLMAAMRSLGWKVSFATARLEAPEPYASRLRQSGIEVLHRPATASMESLLRARGSELDVVVLARYYVAAPLIETVRRHAPRALLVFDTLDLHYVRNRRLAELNGSAAMARSAEAIRRDELDCVRRSDVTWVVSEAERETLLREVPGATVLVQSNVHDAVGSRRPFAEREGLLFVGGFKHPPNVDAATYLVAEILPRLRERLPGVPLFIVGSNAPRVIQQLSGAGLEVVGWVPEVEPWLDRCRVSVSPLRYGAGVKGKVNQAMAHGLPVVATRISVEGMNVVEGEEVLVADDPEEFADAVARLYRDEALWNRVSEAGLENIRRHFSTDVALRGLQALQALASR